MLFLALMLTAASANFRQVMAGAAFEKFAQQTDRSCPSRQLRTITPGDLSWEQEGFVEQLSPSLKRQLAAADRGKDRCAGRNGLSCVAGETLEAMVRTNMLRSFGAFACSHPLP